MTARPAFSLHKSSPRVRYSFVRRLKRALRAQFALSEAEALFEVRGFSSAEPKVQTHLESIAATFIGGYNAALLAEGLDDALPHLRRTTRELAGFAIEGAAMGAAVADAVSFRARRLEALLQAEGTRFTYLIHVGAGCAVTRMPWRRRAISKLLDPVHHWLLYDGMGFADAFFEPKAMLSGWRRALDGYAARAYDQGVGRALWFIFGGDAQRAARWITMARAPSADLWSGLGLAIGYAGGVEPQTLGPLIEGRPEIRPLLAQGAAFAAEAHARSGTTPEWCEPLVAALTGRDLPHVVGTVRRARARIESAREDSVSRYEQWRLAVQRSFAEGLE